MTKRMTPRRWILEKLAPTPGDLPRIEGPVFLLGSAPNPTPIKGPREHWTLVTVNGSQCIAAPWGMQPTMTLFGLSFVQTTRANREARKVLIGRSTKQLLCVGAPHHYFHYKFVTWKLRYKYEHMTILTPPEREKITIAMIGAGKEVTGKASNGVFLALLCLYLGASKVVMSGFSLTTHGHAYNQRGLPRKHIDADAAVLSAALKAGLQIFTNDQGFAGESGLPYLDV